MAGQYDYDLFTIGAGSGGVRAARFAAGYGARVAIAEERYYGGTCVNVGCVPKKLFVYASQFQEEFEDAAGFGWSVGESTFNWQTLVERKNAEIQRLNDIYIRLLDGVGVERFQGRARLVDPHTVEVNGQRITAEYILIATGGWPWMPDIPGIEHAVSSNEMFYLEELPRRVVIVGGGYIAVEFASILNGLGVETTLLYRSGLFLRGFDEEMRLHLAEEMRKKGVDLRFNTEVIERIERCGGALQVVLDGDTTLTTDLVLFATGRRPLTADLGLGHAGVACNELGAIIVDEYSQTSTPNIYAVGDVTDRVNLTPVALAEGMAVAKTLFDGSPTKPDHTAVPTSIFTLPNLGTVGLTEGQARAICDEVDIYRTAFRPLKHTLSGRDERTLMKLVVDAETDRVLGVHMVGPDAGEIIQGFAVALKAGATKAVFDATIGIHPTSAEEFVTMRTKAPRPAA
jgi:glutathione reductase (NADPH)